MADTVTYASDDITSVHYPRVKLTLGPDGTATADHAGRSLGAAVGGAAYVDVTQKVVRLSATPTVTAGAYAANDAVGAEMTWSNAARVSGFPFVVKSVVIVDEGAQEAALELVLFDRTFTDVADNAAVDFDDAELLNHVGSISIAAADYRSFADNSAATVIVPDGGLYVVPNGTDLFGQLYTTGTPTYASTGDISVILTIVQL